MFRPYMQVIFRPVQRIESLIAVHARILTCYTYNIIKLQVIDVSERNLKLEFGFFPLFL